MLERPCPECGFDPSTFAPGEVPEMIRANATAWRVILGRPDAAQRPSERRSDGASSTVDSFARYFVHDPIHHLDDVEEG